jgi:hypothetical protein
MSQEKSNNRAETAGHASKQLHSAPVAFGEPLMFLLDEAGLQEYVRLELQRLNKLDQGLNSAGGSIK